MSGPCRRPTPSGSRCRRSRRRFGRGWTRPAGSCSGSRVHRGAGNRRWPLRSRQNSMPSWCRWTATTCPMRRSTRGLRNVKGAPETFDADAFVTAVRRPQRRRRRRVARLRSRPRRAAARPDPRAGVRADRDRRGQLSAARHRAVGGAARRVRRGRLARWSTRPFVSNGWWIATSASAGRVPRRWRSWRAPTR